jgi:hypothetical protein
MPLIHKPLEIPRSPTSSHEDPPDPSSWLHFRIRALIQKARDICKNHQIPKRTLFIPQSVCLFPYTARSFAIPIDFRKPLSYTKSLAFFFDECGWSFLIMEVILNCARMSRIVGGRAESTTIRDKDMLHTIRAQKLGHNDPTVRHK